MRLSSAPEGASLVLAVCLVGVGCSAPVVDVADASGATTQGLVVIERSAADGAAPQTNVSAKFMRLPAAADPELAERVVGSTFDRPGADECVVLAALGGEEPATSLSSLGSIELLDVGDVTVRIQQTMQPPMAGVRGEAPLDGAQPRMLTEMPLAARAFPDVGDLVFGVFYTSRDAASDLPAPARYMVESSGSGLVDRFSFEVDAPTGPEDVRVGDAELTEGVELEEGENAVVSWRAEAAQPDDIVLVDVSGASGASVRCAFRDSGRGVLPGALLGGQAFGPLPASVTVAVHRVREAAFAASGVDLGEVRFDLSVIGRATLAPR